MSDLVERLRVLEHIFTTDALLVTEVENDAAWPVNVHVVDVVAEAAARISELEAELAEARAQLTMRTTAAFTPATE